MNDHIPVGGMFLLDSHYIGELGKWPNSKSKTRCLGHEVHSSDRRGCLWNVVDLGQHSKNYRTPRMQLCKEKNEPYLIKNAINYLFSNTYLFCVIQVWSYSIYGVYCHMCYCVTYHTLMINNCTSWHLTFKFAC